MLRDRISVHELELTIEAARGGQTCVPTALIVGIMECAAEQVVDPDRIGLLSRELEVLRRLADGDDTKGIAVDMNYSERTVKNVVHDLLIKMNCRNRAHAVAIAARHGII
jgi:DNA-binding NarL/FixJ family response regulator